MPSQHYFVSDLHLFSRRSLAPRYQDAIQAAVAQAETFVLGGDIFDFRWSVLPNLDRTIAAAIDWLSNLAAVNPQCALHFVFGNHDYNGRFIGALDHLAASLPNLHWHRTHLRIGQSLFLHGDVADKPRLCNQKLLLRRQKYWDDDVANGEVANRIYDWVIDARLHHVAKLVHRHKRVTNRLLHYVNHIGQGWDSGVRNVYFGHTHYAMTDYEQGGILFHNGGAPVKGLEFRIVPVELGLVGLSPDDALASLPTAT